MSPKIHDKDCRHKDYLHKEYPKRFERDQFWNQIKRTVNGAPVSERDIQSIVNQIVSQLDLTGDCRLLDLGCGNGALAARLFGNVKSYLGVDFSTYLLSIAEEFFQPNDRVHYLNCDLRDLDCRAITASKANRVLIYGCIAYLEKADIARMLTRLRKSLPDLRRVLIGNIPDRLRASEFFSNRGITDYDLDSPSTPIGVWWEPEELVETVCAAGFTANTCRMSPDFYGARYRFDVVASVPSNSFRSFI